jgi:hypothetical protein
MASCYLCGDRNADYRRNVNTGSSYGTYYGKRSTSSSTRVYFGIRSVCEDCASRVDLGRARLRLIGAIALAVLLIVILTW